jgi:hypothetical protein
MNAVHVAKSIFLEPAAAFAEIRRQPRPWWPFFLLTLTTLALLVWYYARVDLSWFMDQTLSANPRFAALTAAQREAAVHAMSRNTLMISSAVGGALGIALLKVIEAAYYLLAGKVTGLAPTFKQWFGLACWTALPQALAIIPGGAMLLMQSSGQFEPGIISPLSLNELWVHKAMGAPGYSLFSGINLLQIWSLVLVVLGVRAWSGRSVPFSTIFAVLPAVVVYGVWALIVLR